MSPLLAHPEQAGLNALRPGSLYCYGMILYMDAQYTAKFRKLAGEKLPHDQFKKAIASLHPDFSHRSGIRMINDGHYKFARYFSLKQHHIPATWPSCWRIMMLNFSIWLTTPKKIITSPGSQRNTGIC